MSDPSRAPAGWYEDGSGGRRYWDGDTWTQYVAPGPETVPPPPASSPAAPDQADTAVLPTGDDSPTIPFVWGSRGSDAAATTPYAPHAPYAAVGGTPLEPPPPPTYGAPATTMLPGPPFTEPSNPGPHVVGIIAFVVAIVALVVPLIPAVSGFAWILVPAAFVLSIIGLSLRGAKWPAVMGLVVSIVAAIVGIVMLVTFLIGSVGNVVDEIDDAIPDVPALPLPDDGGPGADPDADQPEAPDAGNLRFGETMTWDDGVALTVSVPEPYTPSDFAVGATQANHVVFTLTITNDSSEDLQPLPLPTLSSGDQEVSQIVDLGGDLLNPADDVGIPPTATVEPGGSVTWRVAWSLDDPSSLTLQAAPSLGYPSVTFTNVP
ncbi:DUF308 domain-containing protein [Agromyces sp. NPDC049794]|uniref:DUF308 domain-containing protein n=1 Tax=unclassified Agromyces TaxID=2639701 RepID=UPI0033C4D3C5